MITPFPPLTLRTIQFSTHIMSALAWFSVALLSPFLPFPPLYSVPPPPISLYLIFYDHGLRTARVAGPSCSSNSRLWSISLVFIIIPILLLSCLFVYIFHTLLEKMWNILFLSVVVSVFFSFIYFHLPFNISPFPLEPALVGFVGPIWLMLSLEFCGIIGFLTWLKVFLV